MALIESITGNNEVEKLYPSLEELPIEKSAQVEPQKSGALSRRIRTETSFDASSSLFRALKPGLPPISEETLRTLIANGADPNYTESGESVLSRAIDQHLDVGYIGALFEAGVLPTAQETKTLVVQHGKSIITRAEEANVHLFDSLLEENQIDNQLALSLLRSGGSVNFVSKNGNNSPLVLAITKGADKALIDEMVKRGGDLKNENGTLGSALKEYFGEFNGDWLNSFGDFYFRSPYEMSTWFDDEKTEISLMLINAGAPLDFTNVLGEVIIRSGDTERPELIETLLDKGLDPNTEFLDATPLAFAVRGGQLKTLQMFTDKGIEFKVPQKDYYGNWIIYSELHRPFNTKEVLKGLKHVYPADTSSEGSLGPALLYSLKEGSYYNLLQDIGFDPRVPFESGKTLLATAIEENLSEDKIKTILDTSVYSIKQLSGGADLLQLAYDANRPDVYLLLLQKGYSGGDVNSNFAEKVLSLAEAKGEESSNFGQVQFWAKKHIDNYYLFQIKQAKDRAFASIENKAKEVKDSAEDIAIGIKDKIYHVTHDLFGSWRDKRNDREDG